MQKIIALFFLFFISIIDSIAKISPENVLIQADQLFASQKYTQAYEIYYDLYKNQNKYTPQSLLKMAYIQEALNENYISLYFLNQFYENYPDKSVFLKMKEIAEKERLEGYTYSDLEFFANIYRNYSEELLMSLLALVFVLFLAMVTNRIFVKNFSKPRAFLFMFFLIAVGYMINFGDQYINPSKYIITKTDPLIMSEPSAGSNVLGTLPRGTRVSVRGKYDIWLKIKYGEGYGYIREHNVLL
jgi:uncharacterized protein YgiM (DUF1202 family)